MGRGIEESWLPLPHRESFPFSRLWHKPGQGAGSTLLGRHLWTFPILCHSRPWSAAVGCGRQVVGHKLLDLGGVWQKIRHVPQPFYTVASSFARFWPFLPNLASLISFWSLSPFGDFCHLCPLLAGCFCCLLTTLGHFLPIEAASVAFLAPSPT